MEKQQGQFTRIIEFLPAWDKRDSDPNRSYGVHCVSLRFVLQGPKGAIQFVMYTGWNLPHVREEFKDNHTLNSMYPMAADLGYHSPKPMYDDHKPMWQECQYVDGGVCYYDGSTLNAEPVMDAFIEHGEEAVWEALREEYKHRFEDGE